MVVSIDTLRHPSFNGFGIANEKPVPVAVTNCHWWNSSNAAHPATSAKGGPTPRNLQTVTPVAGVDGWRGLVIL
jgi:hypothetical protein